MFGSFFLTLLAYRNRAEYASTRRKAALDRSPISDYNKIRKIFLSYGGFYADQTVRPLFLRPSASFYAPEHRHDDSDLAVQRRGRTFCVQHGRRHRSERGQYHVPGRDADRGGRLHARHRRQRGRRAHARRGPSRHGEPLFLDVRLCRHPFRRRSERGRCGGTWVLSCPSPRA